MEVQLKNTIYEVSPSDFDGMSLDDLYEHFKDVFPQGEMTYEEWLDATETIAQEVFEHI